MSDVRYRHYHNVVSVHGFFQKGRLAATIATRPSLLEDCVDIGIAVANPNDDGARVPSGEILTFTKKDGTVVTKHGTKTVRISREEGRIRSLEMLNKEPVTVTRESFLEMVDKETLYKFLCISCRYRLKICKRKVI